MGVLFSLVMAYGLFGIITYALESGRLRELSDEFSLEFAGSDVFVHSPTGFKLWTFAGYAFVFGVAVILWPYLVWNKARVGN